MMAHSIYFGHDKPPRVCINFEAGHFPVRHTAGQFKGSWSDMGTETTVIRDAKSDGGVIGLTRKKAALVRWSLTRHLIGEYDVALKERTSSTQSQKSCSNMHEQTQPAFMKRDEAHQQAIVHHIQNNMTDPFNVLTHPAQVLIIISSGMHAPKEVQDSLLASVSDGSRRAEDFVNACLSKQGDGSFYNPIKKSAVKTFTDMHAKTKVSSQSKSKAVHMSSELVFRRALVLSGSRPDANLDMVLPKPVTSVPTSLFHEDGSMRKNTKADLIHCLEKSVPVETVLPCGERRDRVYIRDAMSIIQATSGDRFNTFDDLGEHYLNQLLLGFHTADTVVDVFDRYDVPDSIKSAERYRRQSRLQAENLYHVIGGRTIPPWRKFLNVSQNKAALEAFLSDFITTHAPLHQELINQPECMVYLTGGFENPEETRCISAAGPVTDHQLFCMHEEADTRMIFQATQLNDRFIMKGVQGEVIIRAQDTDVLVLAIHYFPKMSNITKLWLETGHVTSTADAHRFIPVHEICDKYGSIFCDILPAVHAVTGCDSTSGLYSIGKKSLVKIILEKGASHFADMSELGGSDEGLALKAARKLMSSLYDPKGREKQHHWSLNSLRVRLAKIKSVSLAKLPPSESSFKEHVKRASWQTKIWMNSHQPRHSFGSPVGSGWEKGGQSKANLFQRCNGI